MSLQKAVGHRILPPWERQRERKRSFSGPQEICHSKGSSKPCNPLPQTPFHPSNSGPSHRAETSHLDPAGARSTGQKWESLQERHPSTPAPGQALQAWGVFQSRGFYRPLTHSTLWTPVERGKVNPNSQAIAGPANMLLSGENAEHFRSQSQTASRVETTEFLEGLVFSVWHCASDGPWRRWGRKGLPPQKRSPVS